MHIIPLTLLVLVTGFHPVQADEARMFCGHTVDGWIGIFRDKTSSKGDRQLALWALGCFGPDARAAAPNLIDEARQGKLKDEAVEALPSSVSGRART